MFDLANDPNELYDFKNLLPAKYNAMQSEMMARFNALLPDGRCPLIDMGDDLHVLGEPAGILAYPRHIFPYSGHFSCGGFAAMTRREFEKRGGWRDFR